jgi:cytochrome P450
VIVFNYTLFKHPGAYPDPRRFDITRPLDPRLRQLPFGAGPHFCLGYGLAQRELRTVLETLLTLPGDVKIVGRRYARGVPIPAYARLLVRLR